MNVVLIDKPFPVCFQVYPVYISLGTLKKLNILIEHSPNGIIGQLQTNNVNEHNTVENPDWQEAGRVGCLQAWLSS